MLTFRSHLLWRHRTALRRLQFKASSATPLPSLTNTSHLNNQHQSNIMPDDMATKFIYALFEDVLTAHDRWRENNTEAVRRDLVRTIFTAIEGLNWQLRQDLLTTHGKHPALGHHEIAALLEETYTVNDRGKVTPQPRYIPVSSSIRMVVNIMGRIRPGYGLDFGHVGWSLLMKSIEVRNRIAHPKTFDDMHVSDEEVTNSWRAFAWFLIYVIRTLREQNADLGIVAANLKRHLPPEPQQPF